MLGAGAGVWAAARLLPRHAIAALFSSAADGLWLDPCDLSSLFQDAAGTIPVAAHGDPVGLIRDKSGNGNHAAAPSAAARPLYQTDGVRHWLYFDGVDDVLLAAAPLPFSASLFNATAFRIDTFSHIYPHVISNRGAAVADAERHPLLYVSQSAPGRIVCQFGSMGGSGSTINAASPILGRDLVVSAAADGASRGISADGLTSAGATTALAPGGTGAFSVSGTNRFNGRFYGTVQVGYVPPAQQIAAIRAFYAARSGGVA